MSRLRYGTVLTAALALAVTQVRADDEDDEVAGCDSSAGGDVEELVRDQPVDRTIPTPVPTEWRPSDGPQCHRYNGRRMCEGPRRVPVASGPAAAFAAELGLDETRVPRILMHGPAPRVWVEAVRGRLGAGLLWPVPDGRFGRGHGMNPAIIPMPNGRVRRGRRLYMHRGVDIGASAGAPIRAVNDALVAYSYNGMSGYGNSVLLLHADGTVSLYGHCQATYVIAGEQVRRGQVIAEVGETGLAHGTHLHFEWRRDGLALDPSPHFVGRPGEASDSEEQAAAGAP